MAGNADISPVAVVRETAPPSSSSSSASVPPEALLNPTESAVLASMMDRLRGTAATEYLCVQVLRSSDLDVHGRNDPERVEDWAQGGVGLVRGILQWRADNNIDGLADEQLPKADVFAEMWPDVVQGEDAFGRPVHWQRVAQIPAERMLKEFTTEEVIRLHAQATEVCRNRCLDKCAREGLPFVGQLEVLDLTGFGMQHLGPKFYRLIRAVMDVDLTKYDGMMQAMVVINTPWIFSRMWSLLGPLLQEETKAKIFLCDERASAERLRQLGVQLDDRPPSILLLGAPEPSARIAESSLKRRI